MSHICVLRHGAQVHVRHKTEGLPVDIAAGDDGVEVKGDGVRVLGVQVQQAEVTGCGDFTDRRIAQQIAGDHAVQLGGAGQDEPGLRVRLPAGDSLHEHALFEARRLGHGQQVREHEHAPVEADGIPARPRRVQRRVGDGHVGHVTGDAGLGRAWGRRQGQCEGQQDQGKNAACHYILR